MNHRNILIVRNDRMGDLLMSLPAIHEIRKAFPQATISLLVKKDVAPLIEEHPDVDRILIQEGQERGWVSTLEWARKLKGMHFDLAIILNPTRLFHVSTFLAGIPARVGYRRKWGFLLTKSLLDTKALRQEHEVEYNLELVRFLGITTSSPMMTLPRSLPSEEEAKGILSAHGIFSSPSPIAIHPWTSNPFKNWPLEAFMDLICRLEDVGRPLVVIGGPELLDQMERWRSTISGRAIDLVGEIPLKLLPAFLRQCAFLISNDSGPVHVASAVGLPTIVVAPREHGPQLNRWRPLGDQHLLLLSPTVEEVAALVKARLPGCGS